MVMLIKLKEIVQMCDPQTYEMRVMTFYSHSATAVSPTGPTMVGANGPENFWIPLNCWNQ